MSLEDRRRLTAASGQPCAASPALGRLAKIPGIRLKPVMEAECAFNNPGYDILSTDPGTGDTYRIEVKARLAGASDFWITHNEVITGKNAVPRYRLALVRVDPRGPAFDEVRYLDDPSTNVEMGNFEATGHMGDWAKSWTCGREPF